MWWCETTRAEHELALGSVGPKGASAPGSGHAEGIPAGGETPNPMRGEADERRSQRFRERSEGEDKAMMAHCSRLRPRTADVKERPWRPGPATAERSGGMWGRPNDPLPDRPREKRSTLNGISGSHGHEGPSNSMRAVPCSFGCRESRVRHTLQGQIGRASCRERV